MEIQYADKDWKKKLKYGWDVSKAMNLDFVVIKDRDKFVENLNLPSGAHLYFGGLFDKLHTKAEVFGDENSEDYGGVTTKFGELIEFIEEAIQKSPIVLVEIGGESYKDGDIIDNCKRKTVKIIRS
jgi:hypothetical protein